MRKYSHNLNWFGVLAIRLCVITSWKDGDTHSFTWNYLNPLSYPFMIILIAIGSFVNSPMVILNYPYEYGFGLSPYWEKNKEQRVFITSRDI